MAVKVRLSKSKVKFSGHMDGQGAYHPPSYYTGKPLSKSTSKTMPNKRTAYTTADLTNEFRRSTIVNIPRDAIPEYLDALTGDHGLAAVRSAIAYQYDVYRFSPGPAKDWLKAALEYLEDIRKHK